MARQRAPIQVNDFTGGLNTELNPLKAPPNFSVDEVNMEFDRDGSRRKRLGMGFEQNYISVDSGVIIDESRKLAVNTFRWVNAGGDNSTTLLVVQVGTHLAIYDMLGEGSISSNQIYTEDMGDDTYSSKISMAVVDGMLVLVNGTKPVYIYEYDNGVVTKIEETLYIRDLFGVQAPGPDGIFLTDQNNLSYRPHIIGGRHIYNLRNQTFAIPRFINNDETLTDPIEGFNAWVQDNVSADDLPDRYNGAFYPSNTDNLVRYLYADPNDSGDRTVERFFAKDMFRNPVGSSEAPRGFFIIDALERGTSRNEREQNLRDEYKQLVHESYNLPTDKTPGGATVVSEFAGRIWYGGFSGQLIGGDRLSPRMSSYVLFSNQVSDKTDITRCYQKADPTSIEDSALVDTDGGFIRLDGAYGIKEMVALAGSLFVIAENGVWRISGSDNTIFTATGYEVNKLSDKGCIGSSSVVVSGQTILFWAEDAIYAVVRNEVGDWVTQNLTHKSIQTRYNNMTKSQKEYSVGFFDSYENKIRWVYPTSENYSEELVLHTEFSAFTFNRISCRDEGYPAVRAISETEPYNNQIGSYPVTVEGLQVIVFGEDVTISLISLLDTFRESIYVILEDSSPTISYSFGSYFNQSMYDWGDANTGVGYDAYLITAPLTGGEARYSKQVPYLNAFFAKTENGFNTDLSPINPSSCMLSARWNWTSNNNKHKWSTPRQAYRLKGLYFPISEADEFDDGVTTVSTRNKIRGSGKSVSFKFEAEYGKHMHIYGWQFDIDSNDRE